MKLTTIILLAAVLHVSAKGIGQNVTLKFQNAPARQVFKEIIRQTGISIIYKEAEISHLSKITVHVKNVPIEEALKQCFKNQPYSFEVVNNMILVKPSKMNAVNTEVLQNVFPPVLLKGKVADESGNPISGVSVNIKSSTHGGVTDEEGMFSIESSKQAGVIIFSHIEYDIKEVAFTSGTNYFNVTLRLKENKLTDVVIVAYGSESKATQTSAVSSIKSSEINKIPSAQLSTSLAGRLPGAQIVQNSGFVGSNAAISIRGASTNPLYVIDNVVSDKSQFDVLDPGEVESISLLKDAAAAAIYGARAAGGVVVVKTKSGKAGKVVVNYRGILSANRTTQPLQNWTPEQEVIFRNDVALNLNRMSATPNPNFKVPFDEAAVDYSKTIQSQNINEILWRNPFAQQHSLDVSGGSEKVLYFFSANYNNNTGSYDKTNFDKYTLRAKVDANISKNFKIGTNISYNRRYTSRFYWPYDNDNGEGFTVADFYRPTFNLSHLYPYYSKADGTPTTADDPEGYATIQPGWGFNPAQTVNSVNYRHIYYNTFNAIVTAELDIPKVKGLSLRFLGDYRQDNFFRKDFIGEFNKSYRIQTVGTSGIDLLKLAPLKFDANNTVLNNYGRSYTGIVENMNFSERYQVNAFVDYSRSFGNHRVNSFVGFEQSQFSIKAVNGNADQLLTANNDQILTANTATERRYFNGGELNQARLSYFGRLKYDYDSKYIAEFSFRQDGSYIFAQDKQFGFFPSVSAAWVASKESFFKLKPVSTLKLRASYGTTGYDGLDGTTTWIAPYQFQYNYNVATGYVFANSTVSGLAPQNTVPNPNITWATNKTLNGGLDIGLFNDALSFTFDYFTTKRSNILVSTTDQIPGTFGTGMPATNIGEQKVQGFEFSVNYANKIGELNYAVGFNLGYAKDEYVKWPQAANIPDFQNVIGLPTKGVIIGYISKGIVRDQKTIDALPSGYTQFGRKVILGNVLIEDIKGDGYSIGADGKVDANDQAILSTNAIPRINFGAPIDLAWKNISLSLFFQGVGSYDKFVSTINTRGAGGVFQLTDRPYFELWTDAYSQDHNPNGKYPMANGGWTNPDQTGTSTTFWKRNGAFVRLKNINLAYSLPKNIISIAGFTNLQLNLNATNIFTITSFKEHDPEQETLDSYPIFKTFSFGLNLSF